MLTHYKTLTSYNLHHNSLFSETKPTWWTKSPILDVLSQLKTDGNSQPVHSRRTVLAKILMAGKTVICKEKSTFKHYHFFLNFFPVRFASYWLISLWLSWSVANNHLVRHVRHQEDPAQCRGHSRPLPPTWGQTRHAEEDRSPTEVGQVDEVRGRHPDWGERECLPGEVWEEKSVQPAGSVVVSGLSGVSDR